MKSEWLSSIAIAPNFENKIQLTAYCRSFVLQSEKLREEGRDVYLPPKTYDLWKISFLSQ
jgi:hypothetical protein